MDVYSHEHDHLLLSNHHEQEKELGIQERGHLAHVFSRWLDHSRDQKEKWKRLVRFRYLLARMKLNRMVLAWKVSIRKKKVRRLQLTIASHEHYRRVLREAFHRLARGTALQREFRDRVQLAVKNSEARGTYEALVRIKDEASRVVKIAERGKVLEQMQFESLKHKAFSALADYRTQRYRSVINKMQADKLRDRLLLLVHFKQIARLGQIKDRKLAAMRTVNQYLHEKRAKRLITALRTNLEQIQTKEQKMRQACQFHLFRKPQILQEAGVKALRLNASWNKKVRQYLVARAWKALKKGLSLARIEFNETAQGSKVQLYSRLAESIKDEQEALTVFRKGQSELRQSLTRSMQLSDCFIDFRLSTESGTRDQRKLMQSSLGLLSQDGMRATLRGKEEQDFVHNSMARCLERDYVPKIDLLRAKLLAKALESVLNRQLRESFRQIKTSGKSKIQKHVTLGQIEEDKPLAISKEEADKKHLLGLKGKALRGLQEYMARKKDEAVFALMARKYNFLRRLKTVLRSLRRNVVEQKDYRRKLRESDYHFQKRLIARFFSVFKNEDSLGTAREQSLVQMLQCKRKQQMKRVLTELRLHRDNRQEKRMQIGMAELLRRRSLALTHFSQFRDVTLTLSEKHKHQNRRAANVRAILTKTFTQKIVRALHLHTLRSRRKNHVIQQIGGMIKQRVLSETLMMWKIFKLQEGTRKLSSETARDSYSSQLKRKVMLAFQAYQNRQQRQLIKFTFARSHRTKTLFQQGLTALLWYKGYRHQKKREYEQAKKDRARVQLQRSLFKMAQVAAYWKRQANETDLLMLSTHFELRAKVAFAKWKNVTFLGKAEIQVHTEAVSSSRHPQVIKREQNHYDASMKQTLDWLYTFDKGLKTTTELSQAAKSQTIELARPTKPPSASSSIKQFDDFLLQIQMKKHATTERSPDVVVAPKQIATVLPFPQESKRQNIDLFAPALTSQEQQRSELLKREIRNFVNDKQLLRQLEQSSSSDSTVVALLRSSIMEKSASVQAMVLELKKLKAKIESGEVAAAASSRHQQEPTMLLNSSSFMQLRDDYLP